MDLILQIGAVTKMEKTQQDQYLEFVKIDTSQ